MRTTSSGCGDVTSGEPPDVLRGHAGPVRGLAFAADGRSLFSASRDNSVIAWDVEGRRSFAQRPTRTPPLPAATTLTNLTGVSYPVVSWSDDRSRVHVVAADDSATAMIDVASGGTSGPLPHKAAGLTWGNHGILVDFERRVTFGAAADGGVARLDMDTGSITSSSPGPPPLLHGLVGLSGDGRVLTIDTLSRDDKGDLHPVDITVRDAATLAVLQRLPKPTSLVWRHRLNHDGSLLVTTHNFDNRVELWDTRTGRLRWRVDAGYPYGQALALSPDGRTLVVGTIEGGVVLLDFATGRVLARHSPRMFAQIWSADFAADGEVIELGGNDGQVHLLAADNLREIGSLPIGAGATYALATHTAKGDALSAVDERGRIVHWDARPGFWVKRACSIAARNLTPPEWDTYVPGVRRQRTCPTG